MTLDPPRSLTKRDKRYSSVAWRRVREQVRRRDDRTCQACGRREPANGRGFPVDHRTPAERGGAFLDPDNLWLLCVSCNVAKAGLTAEEWYARAERPASRAPTKPGGWTSPYRHGKPAAPAEPWTRPSDPNRDGRPATNDGRCFIEWAMELHGVDAEPIAHEHGRWDVAPIVTAAGATFAVCPASCASPVRWRVTA